MSSYAHFILPLENIEGFFERLKNILQTACRKQSKQGSLMANDKQIRLEFGREEYFFYITLEDQPSVAEEMQDISQTFLKGHPAQAHVAALPFRVSFYGEDDFEMDYFNTFLLLMEAIQAEEKVLILDTTQGRFFD
jgi:hypothetical protein